MSNAPETQVAPDYSALARSMAAALDDLNRKFDDLLIQSEAAPEIKQQVITFKAGVPYTYDAMGYVYWTLFATAPATLTAKTNGGSFPINLQTGYNNIVVPTLTDLTAAVDTTVTAVWSDHFDGNAYGGNNATPITDLFVALAPRDTNNYYSPIQYSNGLPFKTIAFRNGLDVTVDVVFEVSKDGGNSWLAVSYLQTALTAGFIVTYGRTSPCLTAPWQTWRLRIKPTTAPTTGTIDSYVIQHTN